MAQRKKASTSAAATKATAPSNGTNGGTKSGKGGSRRPAAGKPAAPQRKSGAAQAPTNKTGLARLGKGELEAQVLDHLKANPRADVTPSEVANILTRSGGAVANAMERLVRDGKAKRVSDKPRRYRLASAKAAGKAGGNRR